MKCSGVNLKGWKNSEVNIFNILLVKIPALAKVFFHRRQKYTLSILQFEIDMNLVLS